MHPSLLSELCLVGAAVLLSGCGARHSARHPEVDRRVGCYVIQVQDDSSHGGWFPDTIALLGSRQKEPIVENSRDVRLSRRQARRQSLFKFAWRSIGTDSLEIWGSSGFVGVELKGHFTTNGFLGSAASFTDVIGPDPIPRRAVIGTRSTCLGFDARAT